MDSSEVAENAKKARTDALASDLLNIDHGAFQKATETLAATIRQRSSRKKIVITGGAGSGKSTLAIALSKALEIPSFDLDEYIVGGWTQDSTEYKRRFSEALYKVWQDLPARGDWIIEHVEACSPDSINMLRPTISIYVHPGEEQLIITAKAREHVSGDGQDRVYRAIQSNSIADRQFYDAGGLLLMDCMYWTVYIDPRGDY